MKAQRLASRIGYVCLGILVALGISACWPDSPLWSDSADSALTVPNKFTNVAIGGGGYVTGVYLHPAEPDLAYIRTDIGGFYRWQPDTQQWLPLTDAFPFSQQQYYGGEALALDPNNPDVVYVAAGKYLNATGALFRSTDRGETWQPLDLRLPMGGNEVKRWLGDRLVVDPADSQHLLFGSRQDGLWASEDQGLTWQSVEDIPPVEDDPVGISGIVFDPTDANLVYATAFERGIYQSRDRGQSWRLLTDSPAQIRHIEVAADHSLYAVGSEVHRYRPTGQMDNRPIWEQITPPLDEVDHDDDDEIVFTGLTLDTHSSNHLLVSLGERRDTAVFESEDQGQTWRTLQMRRESQVPWWTDFMTSQPSISSIRLDPHYPQRLWLSDWYGVWRTDNLDQSVSTWKNYVQGHEQVVTFALIAPPAGPLLVSGLADVDGFVHGQNLKTYPQQRMGLEGRTPVSDTYGLAYCPREPTILARVGGTRWNDRYLVAVSTNAGETWQKSPSFPQDELPMSIAISSQDCENIVVVVENEAPLYSRDGGQTWSVVEGLPDGPDGPWNWSQPLAADAIAEEVFYYVDRDKVYRSRDGGQTFSCVSQDLPSARQPILKSDPSQAGHLGLALADEGLYHSTDGGATFTAVPQVKTAHLFAFGKATLNAAPPLYIYGTLRDQNQTEGVFRSRDLGAHWEKLTSPEQPIGNKPNVLEASQQIEDLVFVGTNGRGIFYGS
ncbi:MAG: hypothetical protein DCF32_08905 [Leptolyngbya sp.]|nr:MAG: hypothetical protein DCF32_08905 [Leptolyngbya sp.]